jgi:hypothetical protein
MLLSVLETYNIVWTVSMWKLLRVLEKFINLIIYFQVQKRKCDLLYTFSDCRKLIPKFLQLLSDAILSYSSILRKCVQDKEFPDSSKFCNCYYIIKAAEKCICKSERQLTSEDKLVIRTKLENSLLHITDQYPLFAHAIWRLCPLLTWCM